MKYLDIYFLLKIQMANRKKASASRAYVLKPSHKNYAPSTIGVPNQYIRKINTKVVPEILPEQVRLPPFNYTNPCAGFVYNGIDPLTTDVSGDGILYITANPNSRRGLYTPTNVQGYIPSYYCQYKPGSSFRANNRTLPCAQRTANNNQEALFKTVDMWHGYVRKSYSSTRPANNGFNHFCGYRGLRGLKTNGTYTQEGSIIAEPMVKKRIINTNNFDIIPATIDNTGKHNGDVMRLRPHRLLGYTEVYTILALNQTVPIGFNFATNRAIDSTEKPIAQIGLRKPYNIFGKEIQFKGNVLNYRLESNFRAYCFIKKAKPNLLYGSRTTDNSEAYIWETLAEEQITGEGKFKIRADKSNFPLPTSNKTGAANPNAEIKIKNDFNGVPKAVVKKRTSPNRFELVHPNGDPITRENYIIWVGFRIEGTQAIKGTRPDQLYGGFIDVCADI